MNTVKIGCIQKKKDGGNRLVGYVLTNKYKLLILPSALEGKKGVNWRDVSFLLSKTKFYVLVIAKCLREIKEQ